MTTFALRRSFNLAVWGVFALGVVILHAVYSVTLGPASYWSGWLLFAFILLLALYNLRKKLPSLPLGSSAAWLQFHIYGGWLTVLVFILHTGMRLPNGGLEVTLALLFVGVAGSGIVGLALSRVLAPRLAAREEEVIFERIPAMRKQLREKAENLILHCVSESSSTALADFYANRLAPFFEGPRHLLWHVAGSDRPRHALLADLDTLDRYLNPKERDIVKEMAGLIRAKDNLDCHHALQGVLKVWLFVHIPLTYSLVLMSILHALLVSAYSTGLR